MKKLFLLGLLLVGCSDHYYTIKPIHCVPKSILPSGPDDSEEKFKIFEAYLLNNVIGDDDTPDSTLPRGDDDQPSIQCSSIGPPECKRSSYKTVWLCADVCGGQFWMVDNFEYCVGAATGSIYSCDGYAH